MRSYRGHGGNHVKPAAAGELPDSGGTPSPAIGVMEIRLRFQGFLRRSRHDHPIIAARILGVAEPQLAIRHCDQLVAHAEEPADRDDHGVGSVVFPENNVIDAANLLVMVVVDRRTY